MPGVQPLGVRTGRAQDRGRPALPRATVATLVILLLPTSFAAAEVVTIHPGTQVVSVGVLESGPESTTIEYEIGGFTKTPVAIGGHVYYTIGLGGESNTYERGLPSLPNVARSIVIPDDAEMALRVVSSHYIDLPATPVAPSKGVIPRTIDPATVSYVFDPVYTTDVWYPSSTAYLREPYIMRDVRGVVVVADPFQYNPATQTLRVYDRIVVEVKAVGPGRTNVLERRPGRPINDEFGKIYRQHFLNGGDVSRLRYSTVGEAGGMLVICYDSFMTSMEPFVAWKNQMGIPCEMVSVTAAGSTATNIKSYIQDYYDTHDLAFVLLVGDAAQVPTLSAAGGASDPSYSLVAGSDSYPDIFVGRFSAENTAQVETQVLRSVEYEKLPQAGADWYHKGTGIASDQGTGDDGEYDYEHIENIRIDLLGFTYTEVDQIYDPTGTASMVSNALNQGRSIIDYCGHGSAISWGSTGFSNTNVNALVNDNMLPFIFSVACVNGAFTSTTCFGEAWLRATDNSTGEPTGAIAAYMSSINQSWNSPMCAQDEMIDLLVADARRTYGGLAYNGSCQMIDEYGSDGIDMFKTWHIFGDPSLRVRTDTPATLTVNHDDVVDPGASSFAVSVPGVSGALCALYHDGVLYGSAFTNGAGSATIPIGETLPDDTDITLTVTSFNAMPYFGTVHAGQIYVPAVDVAPDHVDMTLEPEESGADTLLVENTGDPLSTLHYDLEIVGSEGARSLTGSNVTSDPTDYEPGTTADFVFSVYNGSGDDEWVNEVSLDFPAGVNVLSCTNFGISSRRLTWDGTTGDGALVTWNGSYSQVVYPGEAATATVSLAIDGGFTGDLDIDYTIGGDGYGSSPHTVTGTATLSPPAGPTVTLTSPNGGEVWGAGETHDITWSWTGSFATVGLFCSTDNGSTWTTIASSTENDGSFSWLVDAAVSTECLIKVVGATDPEIDDASDTAFSIFQPVTWLTALPMSGDVGGGDAAAIVLTFDTTGLGDGDYYADIHVDSDGGDRVTIPIALHVEATGIDGGIPKTSVLYGNYPNPFNPATRISFALHSTEDVRVSVYTTAGRFVRTLYDGRLGPGPHEIVWDGTDATGRTVGSGVYYYRIETGGKDLGGSMVLLK
jgi:hypothetical protein